jgi:hypothetical protein
MVFYSAQHRLRADVGASLVPSLDCEALFVHNRPSLLVPFLHLPGLIFP